MFVITRYREAADPDLRTGLEAARAALAARPGYLSGRIGRSMDDPHLWALVTEWSDVGSYRRALSAYDVKATAVPILSLAIDEPTAFEDAAPGTDLNRAAARSIG